MHIWSDYLIEKNISNIRNKLINSRYKSEIVYINGVLDNYKKMTKIKKDLTEEESLAEYNRFLNIEKSEKNDKTDLNMYYTIFKVSMFLETFNPEYYEFFNKMYTRGQIFLDKSSTSAQKEHYLDPINKMGFIHIQSDFENDESISLIEEFARVFQSSKNDIQFDDTTIAFKDSFPQYLKLSFINSLGLKNNDEIVDEIKKENEKLFFKIKDLPSNLNKETVLDEIITNYFSMFMFLNNSIDSTFDSVDEFLQSNHLILISNNSIEKSAKVRELWSIANKNIEGINHIKDQSLDVKKIGSNLK